MNNRLQNATFNQSMAPRQIEIDFLYLDLEVCTRCTGTHKNLEDALTEVSGILQSTGIEVIVRRTLVETEEQAREQAFFSSPTIRVNGQDIALEFRESRCEDCEECACNGEINCRVWVFQNREYMEAPKGMIMDAILRAVYGGSQQTVQELPSFKGVPDDLKRFFSGKAKQRGVDATSCCRPEVYNSCCGPIEKAVCCGSSESGQCACG